MTEAKMPIPDGHIAFLFVTGAADAHYRNGIVKYEFKNMDRKRTWDVTEDGTYRVWSKDGLLHIYPPHSVLEVELKFNSDEYQQKFKEFQKECDHEWGEYNTCTKCELQMERLLADG